MTQVPDLVRKLTKGSGLLISIIYIDHIISLVSKIWISRYLGASLFGVLSIGMTFVLTVQILALIGIDSGVARYIPRFEKKSDKEEIIQAGFQIVLISSIILSVLGVLAAPYLGRVLFEDQSSVWILRVFALVTPLAVLTRYAVGVTRGFEQSRPKAFMQHIIRPSSRLLIVVFTVGLGLGITGGVAAYVIPFLITGAVGLWYINRHTTELKSSSGRHRELLAFTLPIAISGMMSLVHSDIDTYLLGFYTTTGVVGVYHAVYPLANGLTSVLSGFSFLTMPLLSRLHSNGEQAEMVEVYSSVTKWLLILILPFALIMASFPKNLLQITFGKEYIEGSQALTILSVSFLAHIVMGPTIQSLTSIGKTKSVMYITFGAAIFNIFLNIVLIPEYGVSGAALSTGVSILFTNSVATVILYKTVGIQPISRPMVSVATLSTGSFLMIHYFLSGLMNGLSTTIIVSSIFIVFHIVISLKFGVGEEDNELVQEIKGRLSNI